MVPAAAAVKTPGLQPRCQVLQASAAPASPLASTGFPQAGPLWGARASLLTSQHTRGHLQGAELADATLPDDGIVLQGRSPQENHLVLGGDALQGLDASLGEAGRAESAGAHARGRGRPGPAAPAERTPCGTEGVLPCAGLHQGSRRALAAG